MPDWRELVGKGLSDLKLGAGEKEEVHAELAEHLEETYKALRARGLPEQAAIQQTLAQVADWQDLRRKIQIARTVKENIMNDRVRQLWLPGLLTFALSIDRVLNGLTRPFFGWVSDSIGRELTMLIAFGLEAVGIMACSYVLYPLVAGAAIGRCIGSLSVEARRRFCAHSAGLQHISRPAIRGCVYDCRSRGSGDQPQSGAPHCDRGLFQYVDRMGSSARNSSPRRRPFDATSFFPPLKHSRH